MDHHSLNYFYLFFLLLFMEFEKFWLSGTIRKERSDGVVGLVWPSLMELQDIFGDVGRVAVSCTFPNWLTLPLCFRDSSFVLSARNHIWAESTLHCWIRWDAHVAAANATHCHAEEPGTAGFSGWQCSFEYLMQCVMHDFVFVFCFVIIFLGSVKHYKFSA